MANGNPYFVQTAQYGPAMQGMASFLQDYERQQMMRDQFAAQQAQQAAQLAQQQKIQALRRQGLAEIKAQRDAGIADEVPINRLEVALDPNVINYERQMLQQMNIDNPQKRQEVREFSQAFENAPTEQLPNLIEERRAKLVSEGRDAKDTFSLRQMDPVQAQATVDVASMIVDNEAIREMYALDPEATTEFLSPFITDADGTQETVHAKFEGDNGNIWALMKNGETKDTGVPFSTAFKETAEGLIYDNRSGKFYKPGKDTPLTSNEIEEHKKEYRKTETREVAEKTRQIRSTEEAVKIATESFKELKGIDRSIANINSALNALNRGAGTGVIERYIPSIVSASQELDNIRNQLGLDIISATTFGALSESELEFALRTALPDMMSEEALQDWLMRKKATQQKARDALEEAALFLSEGNTTADLIRHTKTKRQENARSRLEEYKMKVNR